ncbi:MAG TPA: threonine/serine exporter family protein [Vicinamibacteria bacterium]
MSTVSVDDRAPGPSRAQEARDFVLKLGRGLHAYGYSAHRLEDALAEVCRRLSLPGQFFSMPTALFASFGEGQAHQTFQVRVDPGQVDLGRLARLDEVRGQVAQGLSPAEGSARIDAIMSAPAPYGAAATMLASALASGAACRFFGGGLREVVATTLIGLLIGLPPLVRWRAHAGAGVYETTAAALAGFAALAGSWLFPPLSPHLTTLGGLIVLVPGFPLTVAFIELATRNLVAGTARLAGAGLSLFAIAFGAAVGARSAERVFGSVPAVAPVPLPDWTLWAALVVAPVSFAVLFRADERDVPWIVGAAVAAYLGLRAGNLLLGPQLAAFLGAMAVAAFGNAYNRIVSRPTAVTVVPGLLLLVPGSIGFQSVSALLGQETISGVEAAFRMVLVAVSLAMGLLTANAILPARPARRRRTTLVG